MDPCFFVAFKGTLTLYHRGIDGAPPLLSKSRCTKEKIRSERWSTRFLFGSLCCAAAMEKTSPGPCDDACIPLREARKGIVKQSTVDTIKIEACHINTPLSIERSFNVYFSHSPSPCSLLFIPHCNQNLDQFNFILFSPDPKHQRKKKKKK